MTAAVGRIVKLYLDVRRQLELGDVVQTQTGRSYRIVGLRQQTRGKHTGRWHLEALVIDPDTITPDDTIVTIVWYSR